MRKLLNFATPFATDGFRKRKSGRCGNKNWIIGTPNKGCFARGKTGIRVENIECRVGRLKKNVHWKYWEKEKQVRKTQVEIEFRHRAGEYLTF